MQKHTHEYVYNYFKEHNCELLTKEYKHTRQKLDFICECGREYSMDFHTFRQGSRCMTCGEKKTAEAKKIDFNIIQQYILEHNLILLTKKEVYKGATYKIDIKCECGEVFQTTFENLRVIKFKCCDNCRSKKIKQETIDKNISEIESKYGLVVTGYRQQGYKKYFTIQCGCGKVYETSLYNIKKAKFLGMCRTCIGKEIHKKNQKYTIKEVIDILKKEHWVLLSKEYESVDKKLYAICNNGHYTSFTMYRFMSGCRCQQCFRESADYKKENHWNWKGGITSENEIIRKSEKYKVWREFVFQRDEYKCQCCNNKQSNYLNAHHILNFAEYKELQLDINNGITLCEVCHNNFHSKYTTHNNTREQLEEFIQNKK
jgi:5-methylcytosine-specific restriction endonuclease McrA